MRGATGETGTTTDAVPDAPAIPLETHGYWFTAYLAFGSLWLLLHGLDKLGPLNEATFVVIGLLAFGGGIAGLRSHRVARPLPWHLMLVSMVIWIIGGGLRGALGTLGDLSSERALIPDAFSMAGYAVLGSALMILHHQRFGNWTRDLDALLDAAIAALAVAAMLWLSLINPALDAETAPVVGIVLIIYPVLTLALATLVLRFAFGGSRENVLTHQLLVVALFSMLIGDAVYMLVELAVVDVPSHLIDLPYGAAFLIFGAALLHPSVGLAVADKAEESGAQRVRLLAVGLALGVPAAIMALGDPLDARDRVVLTSVAVLLTGAATWRVVRSMNAQLQIQRRLAHAASHDSLTDLPNRTHLLSHLDSLVGTTEHRYLGALFADVDRFKLINDGLGHSTGDSLLQKLAVRLRENTGTNDFIARVGGDEFVVVVTADTVHEIEDLAERLRCSLGVPFRIKGNEIHVSLSVGVRILEVGRESGYETILEDADSALYQAKKRGRNTVVAFDPAMRTWADEQLFVEQELNNALTLGQLSVVYQPIVRLPDGVLEGFEALCRWQHPVMGAISPDIFIPVAEETGIICEIGRWVLNESLEQLREWRRSGLIGQATMSVNLSPRQLLESTLVSDVAEALQRNEAAHDALQLEITEGLLMNDPSLARRRLTDLRDIGVRISLDDFGTGYSSMGQLKSFAVDSAKIDRSFVSGIGYSEPTSDESLVAAIVAMSGALGFTTIAEGVENPAQAARLFELGVQSAQGYHFSRPVHAEQIPSVIERLRQEQLR